MFRLTITLLFLSHFCLAQSWDEEITVYRNHYIAEHLLEARSPIKYQHVKDLHFYLPDLRFRVKAHVTSVADTIGFEMLTYSGKKKKYYHYALLDFEMKGVNHTLNLYQSEQLMAKEDYDGYLFLPFTDKTNYEETFGGGRYLDFQISDIKNDSLLIDFNKAYNPYCAYAGGFNCPIPPKENRLNIAIKAGEKNYTGNVTATHK